MKFAWKYFAALAIFVVLCLVQTDAQAKQKVSKKMKNIHVTTQMPTINDFSGRFDFN